MIRTLQDHGIHRGIEVYMEMHGAVAARRQMATASSGAFGYERERGRFILFKRQGRRSGNRRHRPRLQDHAATAGNTPATDTHWRIMQARI